MQQAAVRPLRKRLGDPARFLSFHVMADLVYPRLAVLIAAEGVD